MQGLGLHWGTPCGAPAAPLFSFTLEDSASGAGGSASTTGIAGSNAGSSAGTAAVYDSGLSPYGIAAGDRVRLLSQGEIVSRLRDAVAAISDVDHRAAAEAALLRNGAPLGGFEQPGGAAAALRSTVGVEQLQRRRTVPLLLPFHGGDSAETAAAVDDWIVDSVIYGHSPHFRPFRQPWLDGRLDHQGAAVTASLRAGGDVPVIAVIYSPSTRTRLRVLALWLEAVGAGDGSAAGGAEAAGAEAEALQPWHRSGRSAGQHLLKHLARRVESLRRLAAMASASSAAAGGLGGGRASAAPAAAAIASADTAASAARAAQGLLAFYASTSAPRGLVSECMPLLTATLSGSDACDAEEQSSSSHASACAAAGGFGSGASGAAAAGGAGAAGSDAGHGASSGHGAAHTDMELRWLAALQRRELQPRTHGPPPPFDAVAASTAALAKAEAKRLLGAVEPSVAAAGASGASAVGAPPAGGGGRFRSRYADASDGEDEHADVREGGRPGWRSYTQVMTARLARDPADAEARAHMQRYGGVYGFRGFADRGPEPERGRRFGSGPAPGTAAPSFAVYGIGPARLITPSPPPLHARAQAETMAGATLGGADTSTAAATGGAGAGGAAAVASGAPAPQAALGLSFAERMRRSGRAGCRGNLNVEIQELAVAPRAGGLSS